MEQDDSIRERLVEIWQASERAEGREALEKLDEGIRLADEVGDREFQYQMRRHYVHVAYNSGDADRLLVALSWCLSQHDIQPGEFDDYEILHECQLALQYVGSFIRISRDQIEGLIDSTAERYKKVNASPRSLLLNRSFIAFWMGEIDRAKELMTAMFQAPTDDLYHLEWEQILEADFYRHAGDDAKLIQWVDKIGMDMHYIARGYVTSYLLNPLVRDGQTELAKKLLTRIQLADRSRFMDHAAEQLVFLFSTGQHLRGGDMLQRLAKEIVDAPSDRDRFLFFGASEFCFQRMLRREPTVTMRLPKEFPGAAASGNDHDVRQLVDACNRESVRLAEQFNARNGSEHFFYLLERMHMMHRFAQD